MSTRTAWDKLRTRLAREQTMLVSILLITALAGRLGLAFAYDHRAVSLVWPPSGIALGVFLLLGYRLWPVVLAACMAVYVSVLGPVAPVLTMAMGNTAEGLLAAYLVNRYAGGRHALQNPRNCLRFAGVVVLASLCVSPVVGALSLVSGGEEYWTSFGSLWITIELGSLVGMLLIGPPIVLFSQGTLRNRWRARQAIEAGFVLLAVVVVGLVVFCGLLPETRNFPVELLCMPVLLWGAVRLGRRAAAASLMVLGIIAIYGTLSGYGPFVRLTPLASLMSLQIFMAITSVMTYSLAALASEYAVAEEQLRELVVTDPLTGLPNYRRLLEVLGQEIARADRTDRPFSVVFFDMDGLKRINDEMGHLTGSRAVCRFAETLRSACRTTDTAARYGGDEFVAVLSDTDFDGAQLVLKRVTERLAADGDQPALAVSAGLAVYPRDGGTPTTLLSAADRALYTVKAEKANARRRGVVGIREWTSIGTR